MPVEKVALEPRFVCPELLGVEGHGLLRKKRARIDPATLEPRRCLCVGHEPRGPAVLDGYPIIPLAPGKAPRCAVESANGWRSEPAPLRITWNAQTPVGKGLLLTRV